MGMKKHIFLSSLFLLAVSAASADSTWKEVRSVLRGPDEPVKGIILQPGQQVSEQAVF